MPSQRKRGALGTRRIEHTGPVSQQQHRHALADRCRHLRCRIAIGPDEAAQALVETGHRKAQRYLPPLVPQHVDTSLAQRLFNPSGPGVVVVVPEDRVRA